MKEFDIVQMPFDEIGIVRKVETKKPWNNRIQCEVIKTPGTFNGLGDTVDYKPGQLKVVKELKF